MRASLSVGALMVRLLSRTSVFTPACPSQQVAMAPAGPKPTTATSNSGCFFIVALKLELRELRMEWQAGPSSRNRAWAGQFPNGRFVQVAIANGRGHAVGNVGRLGEPLPCTRSRH